MKSKLIAFASILCIASLMASGANAEKPENPGHDDKPGNQGHTKTEWIAFSKLEGLLPGDAYYLEGGQPVEGCCLNRGPFPAYSLYLSDLANFPLGTSYDGQVFMSHSSVGQDRKYIVQFWNNCHDGLPCTALDHICIEINGGVEVYDKKTKVTTVTFDNEPWNVMGDGGNTRGYVSFVLTRTPL